MKPTKFAYPCIRTIMAETLCSNYCKLRKCLKKLRVFVIRYYFSFAFNRCHNILHLVAEAENVYSLSYECRCNRPDSAQNTEIPLTTYYMNDLAWNIFLVCSPAHFVCVFSLFVFMCVLFNLFLFASLFACSFAGMTNLKSSCSFII